MRNKDRGNHIEIAIKVIELIGLENLIYAKSTFWRWNGKGLWIKIDDRHVKKLIHKAMENEKLTGSTVASILDLTKTEVFNPDQEFDLNKTSINCQNGELTWNGEQWVLEPHCREHYRISQIPVAFDPNANASRFKQFLEEIFINDHDKLEKQMLLCEMLGYLLVPTAKYQKFFILWGPGANGKSRVMFVAEALVGHDNVSSVDPKQLNNKHQLAYLHGKMVNVFDEIPKGHSIASAPLKAIASGDSITAEHKYQSPFTFIPTCKLLFATNHQLKTDDTSDGFFRRAITITFNRKFADEEQDEDLDEKHEKELPGILNMALEGLARLIKNGRFTEPSSCKQAKEVLRLNNDDVARFVNEMCILEPGARVLSADLYSAYNEWAIKECIKDPPGHNVFSQKVVALGAEHHKGTGGERMLAGIRLKSDEEKTK